jgi:hypothetical protein
VPAYIGERVAVEIIVTDVFAEWYAGLTEGEQESVRRLVRMLEGAGIALPFPYKQRHQWVEASQHA